MSDQGGKTRQPSAKHALDEVLKSLQDLVRNELAEERASPTREQAGGKTRQAPAVVAPAASIRRAVDLPADVIPVLTNPIARAVPSAKTTAHQTARAPVAAAVARPVSADGMQTELPLPLADDPAANSALVEDIPVLQHVVVPPVSVARERAPAAIARRVANEVATRLAAELGRAGTSRLEPAIIRRLEDLLREALEKQAAESPPRS
jgi:hypothetical protein